jgi:polysaccharide deacetylase 2 family uncharacterized protein YibQ
MTKDKMTLKEGDVEITYTVVPMSPERLEQINAAAQSFLELLLDASAFAQPDYTENNSRSVEY